MRLIDDIFDDLELDEEIQDYIDFIDNEEKINTGFVTKARVDEHIEEASKLFFELIIYPDLLIDLITPRTSHFRLFFYQRLILRDMARSIGFYGYFSRGTSKSFLADLDRYLKCMFVPRHQSSIVAGTNKQAAEIAKQKVIDDLWVKFPLLANEMQKRKIAGKILDAYKTGQDYVEFNFKNGSSLNLGNVRGLRRHSLILEEVIEQNPTKVNEQYIPLLNEPRKMSDGLINPFEPQSQQIYITTAGFQGTFAYDKLIEFICRTILEPNKYGVLGGTYRIPLSCGITAQKQIEDVINSPTFSKQSFEREYESRWSDSTVGAALSSALITKMRQVKKVETKDKRTEIQKEQGAFYAISVDMAKDGSADTAVGVAKVIPTESYFLYKFINVFKIPSTDYMVIANTLKKTVLSYNAAILIYDANGVGAGIRDWLNKPTKDANGELLPGFGIMNPPTNAIKDLINYPNSATICYEIKSGGQIGGRIHFTFFSRMSVGALLFPIKLSEAITLYSQNKSFAELSQRTQHKILLPFQTMDLMEAELKNLDIIDTSDAVNNTMKVVRRNLSIQKDFFSMGEYMVWGVNQAIESKFYANKHRNSQKRVIALFN